MECHRQSTGKVKNDFPVYGDKYIKMRNIDVLDYYKQNTDIEITDLFKFLYQSCMGCEHLVSDFDKALAWIEDEYSRAFDDDLPPVESLDGDFCRVHLKAMKNKDSLKDLCEVFILSSKRQQDGIKRLENELNRLVALIDSKELDFPKNEMLHAIEQWRSQGFPAIHHSESFRKKHNPAYRVIAKEHLNKLDINLYANN